MKYNGIPHIKVKKQPTPTRLAMYLPKSYGGPQIRTYLRFEKLSPERKKGVLEHEYAHYVYFEIMTQKERKLWELVSNFSFSNKIKEGLKGNYRNKYISTHAQDFPSEDFAEMWQDYIMNNRIIKKYKNYLDTKMKVVLYFMLR